MTASSILNDALWLIGPILALMLYTAWVRLVALWNSGIPGLLVSIAPVLLALAAAAWLVETGALQ